MSCFFVKSECKCFQFKEEFEFMFMRKTVVTDFTRGEINHIACLFKTRESVYTFTVFVILLRAR